MRQILDYLVENEPAFRKARLPALYSDFQSQRTSNPDGYQANVSAWRRGLARIARSGLAPGSKGATTPSTLVLTCDESLLHALESKQYGRPLALGTVVREALSEKDLVPLHDFLTAQDSIYSKKGHWSVWNVAAWTLKQLGVADMLRGSSDRLPAGQFVVVANVEDAGKRFGEVKNSSLTEGSRFERTFSRTHFYKTFNRQLALDERGKQLSETDMDVLLTFLSRDKQAILYDGNTIKIKTGAADETAALTEEDHSIAQLKELLEYLNHQTSVLNKRIDELTHAAKEAVVKKNRVAALAALKSKKLAESTLERRFATLNQLEEVAAKIEHAADNVQMVKVMESSSEALRSLHAQVGGAERVEEVVDRLREQMDAADEVNSILAEAGNVVIDEGDVDDELAALESQEREKKEKAEAEARAKEEAKQKALEEAEQARQAEETRKKLEAIEKIPAAADETMPNAQHAQTETDTEMAETMMITEA
ncbi:Snf7-domain-containing protein [Diplogelasinospora grovesii]|uniref:Snf7-domain-containing protein n=1 Tax=Diplogelasinospora grovesii TaxID=303347 RepID=A0AAN6N9B5_9PEZI|nr:Snf7-domain-containing protein [Diplogelasinospora grovesii]